MRAAEFKNPEQELYRFRVRIGIAGTLVFLLFGVLLGRFVYLQVYKHEYFHTRAEDNRISLVPLVPNRGLIYDRNGVVLARNFSAYTLEITPSKADDLEGTINELAKLVDIQPKDRKRLKRLMDESKRFESVPIRNRLTDDEVARFVAQRYRFPGVDVKARLFRQYPLGEVASHVLGYMGRVTEKDLERIEEDGLDSNYRGTDHFGKTGLENKYEYALHGETGFEQVEVDAGGRVLRSLSRTSPVSGSDLYLTLDVKLQEVAEKAFGERRGALIAIEPATGGILALVSMPRYDPNLFVDGIDPQNWEALNNSPDKPMVNRALNGAYPPGSTFKPFMALAALELGKRTPQQAISDPGYFMFGGHRFRDDKVGGHGTVDMYKSIVHSCDTYYYILANDLGIDNISRFMGELGFGSPTGIDIDGESRGVLPSQEWKKRRFKKPEQQKWYAGETISIGIGQGYNAYTPIQLAQATAIVANDGVVYRPHLVKYVENRKTGERKLIEPEPLKVLPYKPQNIAVIKRALVGVPKEGTSARAFAGAQYVSAGKTGTAQLFSLKGEDYRASRVHERLRDHALYIAYAPADQPKIALAVLVENGGFGAQSAAPIARQVFDYYLLGKQAKEPAQELTPSGAAEEEGD